MEVYVVPEARRRIMAAIRAQNTKPEVAVRKFLHARGFRFRLHRQNLPGRPDIVLPKYKTVIFVHGCFWHLHLCLSGRLPKTRTEWWREKLERNKARDAENLQKLRELGWNTLVVWECDISDKSLEHLVDDFTTPATKRNTL